MRSLRQRLTLWNGRIRHGITAYRWILSRKSRCGRTLLPDRRDTTHRLTWLISAPSLFLSLPLPHLTFFSSYIRTLCLYPFTLSRSIPALYRTLVIDPHFKVNPHSAVICLVHLEVR